MADNSFKIVARLDIPKSAEEIANDDIPDLEEKLEKKENGKVKIVAELNITETSKIIQKQLETLSANWDIKPIKVGLEVTKNNGIQTVVGGLKNIETQAQKTEKSLLELTSDRLRRIIFDIGDDGNNFNLEKTKENLRKAISEIGNFDKVELSWSFDENNMAGDIKNITATITDANNITESFTFNLEKLGQQFSYVSGVGTDKGMVQLLEKERLGNEKVIDSIEKKRIATIKAREEENKQLQRNQDNAINKTLDDEWKKINKEVSIYHKELNEVVSSWKEQNLYTEETEKAINELRNSLSQVSSVDGMDSWLTEYKNKILEVNANLDKQIKLQNEINALKIQREKLNPKDDNSIAEAEYEKLISVKNAELKVQKDIAKTYKDIIPLAQQEQYIAKKTVESTQALSIAESKRKNRINIIEEKDILKLQLARQKADVLINRIEAFRKSNPKSEKSFGKIFDGMIADLQKSPELCDKLGRKFQSLQAEAKATGQVGNTLFGSIKANMEKFAGWMSMTGVVTELWQSLRRAVDEVININSAMINLKKVTDETEVTYTKFLKNATKQAQELNSSVTNLIEQTATWAKLGFSLDDAQTLSRVSMIYSKVGEVDNTTAVSDLVTVMKAFNIESEESIHIVNSLNQLGNSFATDAKSLGEGLTKSSSALNAANNSFEQSIALLTGGTEITQNASEMGNALKTISMRIRGMKGELQALGEEYENVESISKIQTQILNLTGGHTNIFDDNGNFKSTYDILKSISEVYDDLSDPTKADLTEILFGKMRGNQGIALINAFQSGQIEEAYESALNSAGSAEAEFEAWSKGIEASIERFTSAFQSLSSATFDDKLIKDAIDAGTDFLNLITDIVSEFGLLQTLIPAVFAGLSFKNVGGLYLNTPPYAPLQLCA